MKLLSYPQLKPEKGILYSRSQIHRKIKDGTFPTPIQTGANRVDFVEDEIDAWIAARVAERDKRIAELQGKAA